ncbi:hypothetical protein KY317_02865 [Candidatus Woesearchaeota archaeon]|nr:hypothetical protein [Candidatus Woesearchaeota archaeon]
MIDFIILGIALLTGFVIKLTDLIEDDGLKLFRFDNYLFGAVYGILIAYVIIMSPVVAPLWLGVVIGAGLGVIRKRDASGHYLAAIVMFLVLLFLWDFRINFLLAVFVLAAILDEWMSDLADQNKIKINFLRKFFLFRPIVEISAFITSAITGQWMLWLAILCFDTAYILTNRFINKN